MPANFVVASPNRKPHNQHAEELERRERLRAHIYAARKPKTGVPAERSIVNPWIAGLSAAAMRYLPTRFQEDARYALNPWFDRWASKHLIPGDHLITSFSYANKSLRLAKRNAGAAIVDAGNSHPKNFWDIITEEHKRWKCDLPPVSQSHHRRAIETAELADWVIGLSSFVTESFIARGFPREKTCIIPRMIDLSLFHPSKIERSPNSPFIVVCTGGINLRKGSPYLFEAIRLIQKQVPHVELWLNKLVSPSMAGLMKQYANLPIRWFPHMNHRELAEHLRKADLFVLPSLEDGLARTATEAMGCGLPVILSENTGASDLVIRGVNGDVVPIKDSQAIAEAALRWWTKIENGLIVDNSHVHRKLSPESFQQSWTDLLSKIDMQ